MVILCYNEDNKICRYLTCGSAMVDKTLSLLGTDKYKTYENTQAYSGLDIRAVNDDGSVISLSKQVEIGYFTLQNDEKLDGENIVKLTQEEMEDKFPDRYPKPPETTELELVNQEIDNLEYQEGYRLLKEMGRNSLLKDIKNISKDISKNDIYKKLLEKRKNIIGG